jgi:hypothetical protein
MSLNAGRDTLTFVFYCRLAVTAPWRCGLRVVDVAGVRFFCGAGGGIRRVA